MQKVSIVIPLWNQWDLTKQCLESIEMFTPEEHEIIFVDNGSQDGTNQYLKFNMKPHWKLIENKTNLGFPVACNQGMQLAQGDVILLLNNDTVVSPKWLSGMLECLNSAPDIGIVGPRSNNVSGGQAYTDGKYSDPETYIEFTKNFRQTYRKLYIPRWRIVGFCFMYKRELMDKIGYFDERFTPGNFEDDDYCTRAFMAGYRNMICGDVFVHHHGSRSHDPMKFQMILDANQKKFVEKWDAVTPKTISACMIVKDEERYLGECLKHLEPIVDEIILVDTGSTDKTKEIAASFGKVKIYDFAWVDDFSAARNYASSKATCDWILSVDADEIITGFDKKILWHPHTAFRINTRNYTSNVRVVGWQANRGEYPNHETGTGWFASEKVRIWRNDPRIKFNYPVHEVVEESCFYIGCRLETNYNIQVHHYGRMNDDYEYGHGTRYWKLLQKQWKSGHNDLRSIEQLATQAQGMLRWKEAIEFWDEMLKIEPNNDTALLNKGHCLASSGDWEGAKIWAHRAFEACPEKKEAAMNVAIIEFKNGNIDQAERMCRDLIDKHPSYPLPRDLLNEVMRVRQLIKEGRITLNGNQELSNT